MFNSLGLRKAPPSIPQTYNLLKEPKSMGQARRRFQEQQKHLSQITDDDPAFTYKLPIQYPFWSNDDETPFAVRPGNPKYYEEFGGKEISVKTDPLSTYQESLNIDNESPVGLSGDGIPFYKVKAPMNVNPNVIPYDEKLKNDNDNSYEKSQSMDIPSRDDIQRLLKHLDKMGQGHAIVNHLNPLLHSQNDVDKKPVDLNSAWVIAVIAGVSAAFTVGLLAIGIGWYT